MASINQKDLEAISAYIDQALGPRERARLEERLKIEPELRAELDNMRLTRRILRSTPAYKAPRNFTLTPEMIGAEKSRRSRFLPITRFAFALASIFFVFTLVGNFTLGQMDGGLVQDVASIPAAEEMQAFEAAPAEAIEEVAEDAVIEIESIEEAEVAMAPPEPAAEIEAMDMGDAAEEGLEPSPQAAETERVQAEAVSPTVDSPDTEAADMPSGGGGLPPEPTATPTLEPTPTIVEEVERVLPTGEGVLAIDEEALSPERAMQDEDTAVDDAGDLEAMAVEPPEPQPNYWLVAAAISGGIAVLSGGLSFLLRRK